MAKTPLFSRIRHLTARALPSSANLIARRDLLSYGLGAALSGCDQGETQPPATPVPSRRIAVIGAGIAGLHCAYRLVQAQQDLEVTVYEANTRVGGRIFTGRRLFEDDKLMCELGGEFIEAEHATVLALADEFSLSLDDRTLTLGDLQDSYWVNGALVSEDKLLAGLASVGPALLNALHADDEESVPQLDNTAARLLESSVPEGKYPELSRLLNLAFRAEFGLETDVLAALNLWRLFPADSSEVTSVYGSAQHRYRAAAGNDSFTEQLRARLGSQRVLTDRRLVSIVPTSEGPFQLSFESQTRAGFSAMADYVVFALPFSMLRKVKLERVTLSEKKRNAIAMLEYGTASKLVGAFSGKPWRDHQRNGTMLSDLPFQTAWDATRGSSQSASLLTTLLCGEAGLLADREGVDESMSATLEDIEKVCGPIKSDYLEGSAVRMHWPSSPFVAGSASVYSAGQHSKFGGSEGTPEGKLHFCGEHCSVDFKGTMEGAAETGALVAAQILDELGVPLPEALKPLVRMKALLPQPGYLRSSTFAGGQRERRAIVAQTHRDFALRVLPRLLARK
ncbi:MAG: FAD-dependent oxidoreductase [Myxococcota bacterium]